MSLSLIEERLRDRDKKVLYVLVGVMMILIAGLREPGSTPDSETYEEMYNGTYNEVLQDITEPSFTFISFVLNSMSLGVNALFLTYFYNQRKKLYTFYCILAGILFHYSAATGFVIFLLDFKIRRWEKIAMYLLIPVGIVAYSHLDISSFIPESIGGEKLIAYRKLKDMGLDEEQGGYPLKYHLVIWLNFVVFYAALFYEKYLSEKSNYMVLAIKVQAVGFCCLFFLNGVTMILSSRLNSYFSVASILLWTSATYLFAPLQVGKIINSVINFIRFITSMLFFALSLYFQ